MNSTNYQELQFKTNSSESNENRENSYRNDQISIEKENLKMAPILTILAVVRKSLRKFITSAEDFREARSVMLKVFRSFDPQEKNNLSTRDFCLAVSVLINEIRKTDNSENIYEDRNMNILSSNNRELNGTKKNNNITINKNENKNKNKNDLYNDTKEISGKHYISKNILLSANSTQKNVTIGKESTRNILQGSAKLFNMNNNNNNNNNHDNNSNLGSDVPILSKQEWNEIFNYFAAKSKNQQTYDQKNNVRTYEEIKVDYQKFCDSVLNYNEIKKLLNLTLSTSIEKRGTIEKNKKISNHFNIDDVGTARNKVRAPVVSTNKKSMRNTYDDTDAVSSAMNKIKMNNNNNNNYYGDDDNNNNRNNNKNRNNNNNNDNNNNNILNKPFITGKFKNQTERILGTGIGKYQ